MLSRMPFGFPATFGMNGNLPEPPVDDPENRIDSTETSDHLLL